MTQQSLKPIAVLITRPQPQADRLAGELRAVLPPAVAVVVSPLMRMEHLAVTLPPGPHVAVILTSEAGAMVAGGLRADLPDLVHCVGPRTAEVARAAGFTIGEVAPTAEVLLQRLIGVPQGGPMLYLHGRDVSVRVDRVLTEAGSPTDAAAVYAQIAETLSAEAMQVLAGDRAVLVPLFSARSARLFFEHCPGVALGTIWPCVIAPAVGVAVPEAVRARVQVADAPDGAAMTTAIRRAVASMLP